MLFCFQRAVARRKCVPHRLELWGKTVVVDWAEPEPMVDESVLSKVCSLVFIFIFISNLSHESFDQRNCEGYNIDPCGFLSPFSFSLSYHSTSL